MKSRAACVSFSGALIAVLILPGCATTDCLGALGDRSLTPAQVAAGGGRAGELVRWGGSLVDAQNLADRTALTVIGYPLDRCGVPRLGREPTGRFVAEVPGYLEIADYRPGRSVTVTGLVSGIREGHVGAAPVPLPLLANAKVKLWPVADGSGSGYGFGGVRPAISIGIGGGIGGWHGGFGGIGIGF